MAADVSSSQAHHSSTHGSSGYERALTTMSSFSVLSGLLGGGNKADKADKDRSVGSSSKQLHGTSSAAVHSPVAVAALGTASSLAASTASTSGTANTGDIPSATFFSFPLTKNTPQARWAHTATVVGDSLLVFGGVGQTVLDDLCLLDCTTMHWRQVTTHAPRAKDRPEKMLGHAAAACGSTVWFYGGQQGRKFLRSLYSLDLDSLTWTKHPSDPLPPGRAGHSMVTVHNSAVYMFGGQGKKLYNELYKLDPAAGTFTEVAAVGKAPSPRRGHAFAWDGRDYLVMFGGISASSTDNQLSVFSLSRSEWVSPQTFGPSPSPRTQHSAVMLSPGVVLFFGGCSASGTFYNDVHVLDTRSFTWHKPQLVNTAPAPRYHHTCNMVQGKIVLYGGINSKQTFEGVSIFETKFHQDLSFVAEELFKMSSERGNTPPPLSIASPAPSSIAPSSPGLYPPASLLQMDAGMSEQTSATTLDSFKAQLTDLLVKRNMEETQAQARTKAETAETQLLAERQSKEALGREVMQLKLLLSEAESDRARAQAASDEAAQRANRAAAELALARCEAAELRGRLAARDGELAESRSAQEGLLKELGILAARCSRLPPARGAAAAEGPSAGTTGRSSASNVGSATEASSSSGAADEQQQQQQRQQQQRPSAVSLACAAADSARASGRQVVNVAERAAPQHAGGGVSASGATPRSGAGGVLHSGPLTTASLYESVSTLDMDALEDALAGGDGWQSPKPSARGGACGDGGAGPSSSGPAGASPAGGRRSDNGHRQPRGSSSGAAGMQQQLLARLSAAEAARAAAAEEGASLAARLRELEASNAELRASVAALGAEPASLEALPLEELSGLESRLERSARLVREAVVQRRIVEQVQRRAAVASSEANQCGVCMEAPRGLVFNCGHQSCVECGTKFGACPFCRQTITTRIKLFDS